MFLVSSKMVNTELMESVQIDLRVDHFLEFKAYDLPEVNCSQVKQC